MIKSAVLHIIDEETLQLMNKIFVIKQICDKLADATMEQLVEIGKILKL